MMNITIIGPRSVGKSTVSKSLASKLNKKYISSDDEMSKELKDLGGLIGASQDNKMEEIYAASPKVLKKIYAQEDIIVDLAGGSLAAPQIKNNTLSIISNSIIFGLVPSLDVEESVNILYPRESKRTHFKNYQGDLRAKVKRNFESLLPLLQEHSQIIETGLKSPEEIRDLIIEKLK